MPEHDAVFVTYSHLRNLPRADSALHILRRVASLVKPLVRARQWKIRELAEFYPEQANLLGLNINRGQRILLRLRHPGGDNSLFLPLEQIADTLLHELAHIVHGPHNAAFQALWDQLRDEHMALALKGFTGEAFLSEGRRLGSGSGSKVGKHNSALPTDETRRLARAAAERRQAQTAALASADREGERGRRKNTGHVLGGGSSSSRVLAETPADIRRVVADAVARRNQHTPETLRGCATDGPQYDDRTRAILVDQASRNGFRTQAEEDAANDAAIARALWELIQEDEQKHSRDRHTPTTTKAAGVSHPVGSRSSPIVLDDSPRQQRLSLSAPPAPPAPPPARASQPLTSDSAPGASHSRVSRHWTCSVCTMHNPSTYLVCDACGVEKSPTPKNKSALHRRSCSDVASPQTTQQLAGPPSPHHRGHPPLAYPPRDAHKRSSTAAVALPKSAQSKSQRSPLPEKTVVKKTVRFTPSTYGGSTS
ncbi:hypothetical protein SEPCBS119000_002788 [Sporothrix epigloea]|uniref:Zinc metallopeptidase n=1 Tax=Sporothrix epigloea TaxID=1892477 RepID=A0ABP0DI31_9PEZI